MSCVDAIHNINTVVCPISTLNPSVYTPCLQNISLKQYNKRFSNGIAVNFVNALSGIADFSKKTNTNLYLTDRIVLDDVIQPQTFTYTLKSVYSYLDYGRSGTDFLTVSVPREQYFDNILSVSDDYKASYFRDNVDVDDLDFTSYFNIEFVDDVHCRVSCIVDGVNYYLVVSDNIYINDNRHALFVTSNKIDKDGSLLRYLIFDYLDVQYISFISIKDGISYLITKRDERLSTQPLLSSVENSEFTIFDSSFKLLNNVKSKLDISYSTSFIEYDSDFKINDVKSAFNLRSNYLLSKVNIANNNTVNILNLKNISNNVDSFTSSNSLLSGLPEINKYAEDLRDYTSIFNDIPKENDVNVCLNYVAYNINYDIVPGENFFTAPSSINPFTALNINDTKFVDSGAFAYSFPYYADRVYKLEPHTAKDNAQYLCTWLSGAPGEAGVWVDRYYYPDYLSRQQALASTSVPGLKATINDPIEALIRSNVELESSLEDNRTFFDKKSDLTFEANKKYKYERIDIRQLESDQSTLEASQTGSSSSSQSSEITICDLTNENGEYNSQLGYFKQINSNGGFFLEFNYTDTDFNVQSERKDIDGGLSIKKVRDKIYFDFNLYDAVVSETENIERFSHVFNANKSGTLLFSFNARRGEGALYKSGILIYQFTVDPYKYTGKKILFGDLYFFDTDGSQTELMLYKQVYSNNIYNINLSLNPITRERELIRVILQQIDYISSMTISLPSGMVNHKDNIRLINLVGANLKSKSQLVDLNIKNLNIENEDLLDEISDAVKSAIIEESPAHININKVNFINYKQ